MDSEDVNSNEIASDFQSDADSMSGDDSLFDSVSFLSDDDIGHDLGDSSDDTDDDTDEDDSAFQCCKV